MATNYWQDIERLKGEVAARQREKVVTREVHVGIQFVPNKNFIEYDDPRDEEAAIARWRPILEPEPLDIRILGVEEIPQQSKQGTLDGIDWNFTRCRFGEYPISEKGYARWQAAMAAGIPFKYYLYGEELEEQFDQPTFKPIRKPRPAPLQSWLKRAGVAFEEWKRDPCIVAIIPISPNRGLWSLLAKWYD